MASKKFKVAGTFQWARVFEDNRDMTGYQGAYEDCDGAYSIDIVLDKENRQILKDSGTAKKGKFDDDGNFSVKLIRKHKGPFDAASGPPKVVKPDGSQWSFESDGPIPNGSTGTVTFEVYTTSMSPGTRLLSVNVETVAEMEEKKEETVGW